MARLTYLLIVVLLVLGAVPAVMATRRKPKRRPVEPDDGGDRGTAAPGAADAASQNASYLYCNDTVTAAGSSTAAGSGALPAAGSGCSGGPATMQGASTVVELTWQTADTRLTLQTDSPAMVEAAEWSAAVSRDPPPAQQSRSMAAEQVADRVAGLLLVLEGETSPSVAGTIEGILQPLVVDYGDAVLYDLIGGIMQAMSRRGISEQRQHSMVAMLMFSLADPTAPLHMASTSHGGHTLSTTLRSQTLCLSSGCIRSHMIGTSTSAMSCPWLSSRWHRALYDEGFCQGRWCIRACSVHRSTQLAGPAKYGRQHDIHRVCVMQRCQLASRYVLRNDFRLRFYAGIRGLPRWVGVDRPRCSRQASPHGVMSFFYRARHCCRSFPSLGSQQPSDLILMTCICVPFLPWFLSPVACRVMEIYHPAVDGRALSYSASLSRPASSCAGGTSYGLWSDGCEFARIHSLSGIHLWDPVCTRAPGAWSSSALTGDYLSRLAQVSLGVAISFGPPAHGANSSNCLQSLLSDDVGFSDIMPHRLQDASIALILLAHAHSHPTLRFRLQLSGFCGQPAHNLTHTHPNGYQDWALQVPTRTTRGSSSVGSTGPDAVLLSRLFLSGGVNVWSACTTLHPGRSSLCHSTVMLATCIRSRSAGTWHFGCRCHRASLMLVVAPGPSGRDVDHHCIYSSILPCQVTTVEKPPTCWTGSPTLWIVHDLTATLGAAKPSIQHWPALCHCGSGKCAGLDFRQDISVTLRPAPTQVQHTSGSPFVLYHRGCCAMGHGGHRGRRPHKSPASIARSKQRPGKRERRAQRDAVADADPAAASAATSGAPPSSAAALPAAPIVASSHAAVASVSGTTTPTVPKAKATFMPASTPLWLDPASPLALPGSAFSLLTRPKSKAAPALPPQRGSASAEHGQATAPPPQNTSIPAVTSPTPPSQAVSAEVTSAAPPYEAVSAGSLPVHGPFLRPKATAPSSSSWESR